MSFIHEISYQWFAYWWPSIRSNGPEAITQVIIGGVVAVALWPMARKFARNEMKRVHSDITGVDHELEKILPDMVKPFRWLKKKVLNVR